MTIMAVDTPSSKPKKDGEGFDWLEGSVGLSVVLLATFLGICNVKDGNIVQQMQQSIIERNNQWLWFQARNIRMEMYLTAADEMRAMGVPSSPEDKTTRDQMIALYEKKAKSQDAKMKDQETKAEELKEAYGKLNELDDKFDICEAALAVGLAMMGVTALIKRWWLFVLALVPSLFGVYMGVAGFAGLEAPVQEMPIIGPIIRLIL
ncbi:MAG: DUF4337 domain-containing protein [Acidimicrobiia bacterium]|nr:DUF4337 domain-containing protein [Acidimicrobiia bacterium]